MSTTPKQSGTPTKAEQLEEYLRAKAANGELYFKSKYIADEVGLSSKEIGALLVKLQGSVPGLHIEKWSYSGATTWRIHTVE